MDRSAYCQKVNLCNILLYKAAVFHHHDHLPVSVFPKDGSNRIMKNIFSSYFIEKIRNIRSGFPSLSQRATSHTDVPSFSEFSQGFH